MYSRSGSKRTLIGKITLVATQDPGHERVYEDQALENRFITENRSPASARHGDQFAASYKENRGGAHWKPTMVIEISPLGL
jgi:hypothetical protein